MNLWFWVTIAVLVVIALLIVVPPLFKKTPLKAADGEQRNVVIARQQLQELKLQLQSGALSQAQYDAQFQELQLTLLDDLEPGPQAPVSQNSGRWVVAIIILMLPLLSLFLYGFLGDANAIKKAELQQANQKTAENVQSVIKQLQDKLKQKPDDIEGWTMLARAYVYIQQYQNAADVFAEINRRQPNNPEVMLQYADSLAMSRDGRMSGEPAALAEQALKQLPEDKTALWLVGMAKAEAGEFAEAIRHWQKLSRLLPADAEAQQQVGNMIKMAEAEQQGTSARASTSASVDIHVHVDINAALKAKADAQQTVFIYAQAATGPKMPLAIVRKQLKDLPLDVVLNDSMAMQPQMHLADFKQLRIVARLSKTGNAMQQSGDLIGTAELDLATDNHPLSININQEVK